MGCELFKEGQKTSKTAAVTMYSYSNMYLLYFKFIALRMYLGIWFLLLVVAAFSTFGC